MNRLLQLARLNARVAGLALRGRWLGVGEIAAGYDCAAPTYDQAWQCHLRNATDDLLGRLPCGLSGTILDLGSGTGYCARRLARTNPETQVIAVDISKEMLSRAGAGAPPNLRCVVCDMLEFVQAWKAGHPSLIVSTWALGYSHPARLISRCGALLSKGCLLAFIVNYRDTLAPVFRAFQRCMLRFPGQVRLAAIQRFPKDWLFLEEALKKARFNVVWRQDGRKHIERPKGLLLPWLRQTGILAGFDGMLDLSGPAAAYFEEQLSAEGDAIFHHFVTAIAQRK
jgi:trans-aconitate methyltransferase